MNEKIVDPFEGDPFDGEIVAYAETNRYEYGSDVTQQQRDFLERRANAYKAVFREGHRSQSDIDIVLKDLLRFTRAVTSRHHADPRLSDVLEGRAEVFYRINDHVKLDTDTLFRMFTEANLNQPNRR